MPRLLVLLLLVLMPCGLSVAADDEKLFSGPQAGEKLPSFKVKGVLDHAGKELDLVKLAAGKPLVLVFVHEANRPSIGMTRVLMNYTATRAKDGLHSGLVWLAEDATEAETQLKRMKHALPEKVPVGISVDGKEGPGSYGLNRKMTLTILVAKEGKVTANFALVQPSIQADLPRVLEAIAKVAGGKAPKLEDLPGVKEMLPAPGKKGPDAKLTELLRSLIRKTASAEDVDKTAAAIEAYAKENADARREVARISSTIVNGGKLKDYGTERAQAVLIRWAKEYGGDAKSKDKDKSRE
jgi:hypothetical protein